MESFLVTKQRSAVFVRAGAVWFLLFNEVRATNGDAGVSYHHQSPSLRLGVRMNILAHVLVTFIGVVTIASCAAFQRIVSSDASPITAREDVRAGPYRIGNIQGWSRSVESSRAKAYRITRRGRRKIVWVPSHKQIVFRRTAGENVAEVEFTVLTSREKFTSDDVMAGMRAAEWLLKTIGPSRGKGAKSEAAWSKKTRFDGNDAYVQSSRFGYGKENIPVEQCSLTFWKGKSIYTLTRSLRGTSVSPELRQKTQQAWSRLYEAVKDQ